MKTKDEGEFMQGVEWSCQPCKQQGTMKPWRRPGESRDVACTRTTYECRQRCVPGCSLTVRSVQAGKGE